MCARLAGLRVAAVLTCTSRCSRVPKFLNMVVPPCAAACAGHKTRMHRACGGASSPQKAVAASAGWSLGCAGRGVDGGGAAAGRARSGRCCRTAPCACRWGRPGSRGSPPAPQRRARFLPTNGRLARLGRRRAHQAGRRQGGGLAFHVSTLPARSACARRRSCPRPAAPTQARPRRCRRRPAMTDAHDLPYADPGRRASGSGCAGSAVAMAGRNRISGPRKRSAPTSQRKRAPDCAAAPSHTRACRPGSPACLACSCVPASRTARGHGQVAG